MIWPFKRKNKLAEFNKMRASVGMDPIHDNDYCEAVAWVFVFELLAADIDDECKRRQVEERALFMMAYASYLKWLIMTKVESNYPPNSWQVISSHIERELCKQQWYNPEVMNKLFNAMVEHPPMGNRYGKHTKVLLGPWADVELVAIIAGFNLSLSTSLEFTLYVTVSSTKIIETITKMAPKK